MYNKYSLQWEKLATLKNSKHFSPSRNGTRLSLPKIWKVFRRKNELPSRTCRLTRNKALMQMCLWVNCKVIGYILHMKYISYLEWFQLLLGYHFWSILELFFVDFRIFVNLNPFWYIFGQFLVFLTLWLCIPSYLSHFT